MKAQVQAPRVLHPGLHTGHLTLNLGLTNNDIIISPESPSQREDKAIFPSPKTKSTLPSHHLKFRRKRKRKCVYGGTPMRDIVGPLRRVALDWTPDWTREKGLWTLDPGPSQGWSMDPASMFCIHPGKKASGWITGESEGTPEVLLTKACSGIPDSGTP